MAAGIPGKAAKTKNDANQLVTEGSTRHTHHAAESKARRTANKDYQKSGRKLNGWRLHHLARTSAGRA